MDNVCFERRITQKSQNVSQSASNRIDTSGEAFLVALSYFIILSSSSADDRALNSLLEVVTKMAQGPTQSHMRNFTASAQILFIHIQSSLFVAKSKCNGGAHLRSNAVKCSFASSRSPRQNLHSNFDLVFSDSYVWNRGWT